MHDASTPRTARSATGCRGAGRRSTTASCAELLFAQTRRALRDRQGRRRAPGDRSGATPTAATDRGTCAARSSTRSAGGACSRASRLPAARGAALARPRGPPARRGRRDLDVWIDRSLVRRGYGWSVPGGRRAARRRRLLRAAPPRQGADRRPRRAARASTRSATRATGSRTACARRPRTACSSSATAPATASRSRARGSAPRSTSGSPCGRELRGGARRARARARRRWRATRAFSARPRARVRPRAAPPAPDPARCRRALLTLALRAFGRQRADRPGVRLVPRPGAPGLRVRGPAASSASSRLRYTSTRETLPSRNVHIGNTS